MVRSGGAAASSSPLAGAPAPRGRAGRAGGPGALPARLARHRRGGRRGRPRGTRGAPPGGEGCPRGGRRPRGAGGGAIFSRALLGGALATARQRGERPPTQRELLDALWELVWAGEVTNDTFAPLRALRWKRSSRDPVRPRPGSAG